jgi:multiple antibiotic resistance protein
MILGIRLYKEEETPIVPIAFLIAGAGTMTTLLSLKSQYHTINIIIAIQVMILVYLVKIIFSKSKNAWVFGLKLSERFWSYITCNRC